MAVLKLKSEASYRSHSIEVRAKVSVTVRWSELLPRRRLPAELSAPGTFFLLPFA